MDELLVGNPECTFIDIVKAILSSISQSDLKTKWIPLATALKEKKESIKELEDDVNSGKMVLEDIIEVLLVSWRSRCSSLATLSLLIEIFNDILDCKTVSDAIFDKFRAQILRTSKWTNLSQVLQSKIWNQNVTFLGLRDSVRNICEKLDNSILDTVFENCRNDIGLWDTSRDILLTRPSIPHPIPYYVPRTLSYRKYLDPNIFKSSSSDIFCFRGFTLNAVQILAEMEPVAYSKSQIEGPTVRFILLESEQDFDNICRHTVYPVHLIQQTNDDDYEWVKSQGSLTLIQGYLLDNQDVSLHESFLVDNDNFGIHTCVIDTPGMGKTVLLANLATRISHQYPDDIVIFCRAADVFNKSHNQDLTAQVLKQAVCQYVGYTKLGQQILLAMTNSNTYKIHLFLDGIDEVRQSVHVTMTGLRDLAKCTNIRLYISSRPHLRIELEQALSTLSRTILPFQPVQQVNFLIDYWGIQHKIENNSDLEQFAENCIATIKQTMTDGHREITGVPLQCRMVGDIYADEAEKVSRDHEKLFPVAADISSIFHIYEKFVDKRFQKLEPEKRLAARKFHIYFGYKQVFGEVQIDELCLFPDNQDNDAVFLNNVPWDEIILVGLMEQTDDKTRFVHDSFAEFLLAEFITDCLTGRESHNSEHWSRNLCIYFMNDVWKNYNFSIGPQYLEIFSFLTIQPTVGELCKNWEPVATALGIPQRDFIAMNHNIAAQNAVGMPESITVVYEILTFWTKAFSEGALVGTLIQALEAVGFTEISDALRTQFGVTSFKNPSLWYFVDAFLFEFVESPQASPQNVQHSDFYSILYTNTTIGYCNLPRLMSQLMLVPESQEVKAISCDEKQWNKILISASENCNVKLLEHLLSLKFQIKHSVSPDLSESLRATLLKSACKSGNFEIVEYLLKKYQNFSKVDGLVHSLVDKSYKDSNQMISRKKDIIDILKNYYDDKCLNERDSVGQVPLHYPKIHFELIKHLIISGADVMAINGSSNGTFLHSDLNKYSADQFHELVQLLLDNAHGKIFGIEQTSGGSVVSYALSHVEVHPETLDLLVSRANYNLNRFSLYGRTDLQIAILFGRSRSLLEALVNLGARWPLRTISEKSTVLHLAAECGHLDALRYFLSLGAEVDAVDKYKRTPLHFAVTFGKRRVHEVVDVLLEHGASCNTTDNFGSTPLHDVLYDRSNVATVEDRTVKLIKASGAKEVYNDKCIIS